MSTEAWHEYLRNLTGNDDRVSLDRAEMNRLVESGATAEQVRAWLHEQISARAPRT